MGLTSSKSGFWGALQPPASGNTSTPGQDDELVAFWGDVGGDVQPDISASDGPELGVPRFRRGLLWTFQEVGKSPTVESTINHSPLPRPGAHEFRVNIQKTIKRHPHLFQIVTPIKVSAFEQLLHTHPNQAFVKSVVVGLREGFWPFANTHPEGGSYPLTHDASCRPPRDQKKRNFLSEQCKAEIRDGRFSEPFGTKLLPGMYSMPIHAVPKQGPSKFRLVVDHSASEYSLNNMISRDDSAGTQQDTIKDLVDSLIQFRRENGPFVKLKLFKSDVSSAYRRLPMHPLWQIKQIVTVDGQRHVDRCNSFGNRGSQRLWVGFMALVTWVAINVRNLPHLKLYTDDCFSFELASSEEYYAPYNKRLPTKQARLLKLWDEIGIPHEERKQVSGETLEILGFLVDPNAMTITLPKEKLDKLLSTIQYFCSPGSGPQTLNDLMRLAGFMAWSLDAFPMLKPGLRALHAAIGSNSQKKLNEDVDVDAAIKFELSWFAAHAEKLQGVHIIKSIAWTPAQANHHFFCDASRGGLGCYYKEASIGFRATSPPKGDSFFLKALSVCWAIHISHRRNLKGRILIYTDNLSTVEMFDRLHTSAPDHNPILLSAVDILINDKFAIQVVVDSNQGGNEVAYELSHGQIGRLRRRLPNVSIVDTESLPVLPSYKRNTLE